MKHQSYFLIYHSPVGMESVAIQDSLPGIKKFIKHYPAEFWLTSVVTKKNDEQEVFCVPLINFVQQHLL